MAAGALSYDKRKSKYKGYAPFSEVHLRSNYTVEVDAVGDFVQTDYYTSDDDVDGIDAAQADPAFGRVRYFIAYENLVDRFADLLKPHRAVMAYGWDESVNEFWVELMVERRNFDYATGGHIHSVGMQAFPVTNFIGGFDLTALRRCPKLLLEVFAIQWGRYPKTGKLMRGPNKWVPTRMGFCDLLIVEHKMPHFRRDSTRLLRQYGEHCFDEIWDAAVAAQPPSVPVSSGSTLLE